MKSNPKPKSLPKVLAKKKTGTVNKTGSIKIEGRKKVTQQLLEKGKQTNSKPKSHPLLPSGKKIGSRNVKKGDCKGDTRTPVKKTKHCVCAKQRIAARKQKQGAGNNFDIASDVVIQAIEGVRKLEKKLHEKKGKGLLDDGEDGLLYMQLGMLKVSNLLPLKHVIRPVRIRVYLPNSVVNSDTEVLLIARDEDNKKKRQLRQDFSEHLNKFQEMIRLCGASKHINEVMTLRQLKVEYKEYEGKRHLADRFDVILVDDTIIRRIPMFLGKHFYKKRKFPIQVNLKAKNVLAELEKALTQTVLWLPMTGNSSLMTIGHLSQTNEMIEENIRAALKKLREKFPGGWANIQNISLKSTKSKSVPIYAKLSSANDILPIEPKPLHARKAVVGEVNTYFGNPIRVYPDGAFKVITMQEMIKHKAYEQKMEAETEKSKSKNKNKKQKKKHAKTKAKKETVASSKKKKYSEQSGGAQKKLKTSKVEAKKEEVGEEEGMKIASTYDSMDVEDLGKMEMEYLKRISMKEEREKKEKKSSGRIVPDEDSDDAWAEFSDDDILSDFYDEEL